MSIRKRSNTDAAMKHTRVKVEEDQAGWRADEAGPSTPSAIKVEAMEDTAEDISEDQESDNELPVEVFEQRCPIVLSKREAQKRSMIKITQAWRENRMEDGLWYEQAEQLVACIAKAVDSSLCSHDDAVLCGCNEADTQVRPLLMDAKLLKRNHSDGYVFHSSPIMATEAARVLTKALKKKRSKNDLADDVVIIKSQMLKLVKDGDDDYEIEEICAKLANAFSGRLDLAYTLPYSARMFHVSTLKGMQFTSSYVSENQQIVKEESEVNLYHPAFYLLPAIESFTFSTIFACTEGSIMLTMWPGTIGNLLAARPYTFLEKETMTLVKYVETLSTPFVVHLVPGQMVVVPPMAITSTVAIEASVVLIWRSIPSAMMDLQGEPYGETMEKLRVLSELTVSKRARKYFEKDVRSDRKLWCHFQAQFDHNEAPHQAADEVIRDLESLLTSQ